MINKLLAVNWGTVAPPPGVSNFDGGNLSGISVLFSIILRTMIVGAGLYAVFNFLLAGYAYLSAGGDSKQVSLASAKITQSVIGLTIAAGAFVIAGIVGRLFFNDASYLLQIRFFTPK